MADHVPHGPQHLQALDLLSLLVAVLRTDGSVLYERGPLQPTQIRAQRTRAFEAYGAGHDAPLLSGQLRVSTEDDQLLLQRIASILVAASLFGDGAAAIILRAGDGGAPARA